MKFLLLALASSFLICACHKHVGVESHHSKQTPNIELDLEVKLDTSSGNGVLSLSGVYVMDITAGNGLPGVMTISEKVPLTLVETETEWSLEYRESKVTSLQNSFMKKSDALAFILKHRIWQIIKGLNGPAISEDLIYIKLKEFSSSHSDLIRASESKIKIPDKK
jgi:hypothetical protein